MAKYFSRCCDQDTSLNRSASDALEEYIKAYEKQESYEIANALSTDHKGNSTQKLLDSLTKDVKTLDEEIVLAKRLLPTPSETEIDNKSQTTEDLLVECPLQQGRDSEKWYGSPSSNLDSSFLSVSDLKNQWSNSRPYQHGTQRMFKSTSTFSTSDTSSRSNLRCLKDFLQNRQVLKEEQGHVRSAPSTPFKTKLSQSHICTSNIKGDLSLALNYLQTPENGSRQSSWMPQSENPKINASHQSCSCCYSDYKNVQGQVNRELFCKDDFVPGYENDAAVLEDSVSSLNNANDETAEEPSHISLSLQLEGNASDIREFMGDCFAFQTPPSGEESSHEEGAVESLKNMLFSLQEMARVTKNTKLEIEDNSTCSEHESSTGCESLEKAIKHLSILKTLVKEIEPQDL